MMTNFGHAAIVLCVARGHVIGQRAIVPGLRCKTVITQPVPLTQAQRTTIYRTIIPQGRGRQPIVRERIVTEPVAPVVRERVVTGELDAYAYGDGYAYNNRYGPPIATPMPTATPMPIATPMPMSRAISVAMSSRTPIAPMPMPLVRACRSKPGWRRSRPR